MAAADLSGQTGGKPRKPKLSRTERVIFSMLTENTGRHMLDSGGAYGRHWERNRQRDITQDPEATLRFDGGYIDVRVSLYHFLRERVEFNDWLDRKFRRWANANEERKATSWHGLLAQFGEELSKKYDDITVWGDAREPLLIYTYNEDNVLSQDIYYLFFEHDYRQYVLLGSHNGCDARGGFAGPRGFELSSNCENSFFDYNKFTIECSGERRAEELEQRKRQPAFWPEPELPDRHLWDYDGYCAQSQSWPRDGDPDDIYDCSFYFEGKTSEPPPSANDHNVIVVRKDGVGLCPRCRSPLRAYPSCP